jgi:hypothetical protein
MTDLLPVKTFRISEDLRQADRAGALENDFLICSSCVIVLSICASFTSRMTSAYARMGPLDFGRPRPLCQDDRLHDPQLGGMIGRSLNKIADRKASPRLEANSFNHLRSTFSCKSVSRADYSTTTPRSRTNLTASNLHSR